MNSKRSEPSVRSPLEVLADRATYCCPGVLLMFSGVYVEWLVKGSSCSGFEQQVVWYCLWSIKIGLFFAVVDAGIYAFMACKDAYRH